SVFRREPIEHEDEAEHRPALLARYHVRVPSLCVRPPMEGARQQVAQFERTSHHVQRRREGGTMDVQTIELGAAIYQVMYSRRGPSNALVCANRLPDNSIVSQRQGVHSS